MHGVKNSVLVHLSLTYLVYHECLVLLVETSLIFDLFSGENVMELHTRHF